MAALAKTAWSARAQKRDLDMFLSDYVQERLDAAVLGGTHIPGGRQGLRKLWPFLGSPIGLLVSLKNYIVGVASENSPSRVRKLNDSRDRRSNATDSRYRGSNATESRYRGSNATESSFRGSNATESRYTGSNATESSFRGSNATESSYSVTF